LFLIAPGIAKNGGNWEENPHFLFLINLLIISWLYEKSTFTVKIRPSFPANILASKFKEQKPGNL